MVVDGGGGAAAEFLEFLGEFAGDADEVVWGEAGEEFEGAVDAVRAFEEDGGFGAGDGGEEGAFALTALTGRKPPNMKASAGKPLPMSAVMTALGPGMTSTRRLARRQALTRRWPGSETPGMPASEM